MESMQDAPGPDHEPVVTPSAIDGVVRQRFPSVTYAHGALTEIVNSAWHDMFTLPVEHLYVVANSAGRREEWYEHRLTTDRYVLLSGSIRVALFDPRVASTTRGVLDVIDLSEVGGTGDSGLVIPAGVWHSFRIDSERAVLVNAKTPGYQRSNPDKYRLAMPNELTPFTWEQ